MAWLGKILSRVRARLSGWYWDLPGQPEKKPFERIYRRGEWLPRGASSGSLSGPGSEVARTEILRRQLPGIIEEYGIRSILDAACGDFNWMKETDLGPVLYTGIDIVPFVIEKNKSQYETVNRQFKCLNLIRDKLPPADLILCRDCIQHLSLQNALVIFRNFKSAGADYLLTTTYPQTAENTNIVNGDCYWNNLQLPPFNFPEPLKLIRECPDALLTDNDHDKHVGLWRLRDLPL